MQKRRKKKVIVLRDGGLSDLPFKKGFGEVKQKSTLKKIAMLAGGSLAGNVAVMLTNRLSAGTSPTFQYALGALSSGAVTIGAFGLGQPDIGFGSGLVAAGQIINTGTYLLANKSLDALVSSK